MFWNFNNDSASTNAPVIPSRSLNLRQGHPAFLIPRPAKLVIDDWVNQPFFPLFLFDRGEWLVLG